LRLPKKVIIKEVGPRDGLQNEKKFVSTNDKLHWIQLLEQSGLNYIEVSSFVRPDWIPQLSDSSELFMALNKKKDITYAALVPNKRGLTRAFVVDADEVNFFLSASETHNRKNKNVSIEDSLNEIKKMVNECKDYGKTTRVYISTVFGCPYEGNVDEKKVISLAESLLALEIDEISFGDTIGIANPYQVGHFLEDLLQVIPAEKCAMHFHDTYGRGISNIYESLRHGISVFDASTGGFGGCPYAPGASGNVATEDVVSLLNSLGIETNVRLEDVVRAATFISDKLHKQPTSKLWNVIQTTKEF
jgi:hydroxymethylglutaryl-CoA lyase